MLKRANRTSRRARALSLPSLMAMSLGLGALSCEREASPPSPTEDEVVAAPGAASAPPIFEAPDLCRQRLDEVEKADALPGAREFEELRVEILGRARAVPVLFLREPQGPPEEHQRAARLRRKLEESRNPTGAILDVLRATRRDYEMRRDVFLSEHYLFADKPLLALRLSQVMKLDHLFDSESVIIHRGSQVLTVVQEEGKYWHVPPSAVDRSLPRSRRKVPKQASLLLFDRVFVGPEVDEASNVVPPPPEPPPGALHMDFRDLQDVLHFSYLSVDRITEEGVIVTFHTGPVDTTALVRPRNGKAVLECEARSHGGTEGLRSVRRTKARREELVQPILDAAREMVNRQLPFDEPRTEEGQQDGKLRVAFWDAYWRYREIYEFNGDEYYVFDGYGRPRIPQVCIDFITDAFDWGTGGRWPNRGEKRLYKKGAFRFKSFDLENPRSVEEIASFASENPEWFDMHWLDDSERVKFLYRSKFFEVLGRHPERYQRGDVVFIYGLRDDEKFHYHSFFVDQRDPVSGVPTLLSANAGPPQLRTWEGEMQNAPLRSIVARMRVRSHVLERAYAQARRDPGVPLEPPPRPEQEKARDGELD